MAKRSPYTFPDRTRKAMLAYLADHQGYWPMSSWNGGFVLAWNIKVHAIDEMGKAAPADFPAQDRFDDAWRALLDDTPEMFAECCEDATRMYTESEWTNYPGIEQGEWKFDINGRSGGYMILDDAPGWLPRTSRWSASRLIWESRGDYQDWLAELDTATLRRFYRAIRVLDHDLRREACEAEVSYHFAARRNQWEEEMIEAEACEARKMERARPDLYV